MKPVKHSTLVLLIALGIFGLALAIYLPRVASTVQESDGGELATAAVTKSLIHPPGYPLYAVITQKIVQVFPENPYQTLARFSAVCQALAGAVLFLTCFMLSQRILLAACLTIAWLFYEPTIQTALDVEVFGLHHLFSALIALQCALYSRSVRHLGTLMLLGLSCGLAASHHHMIILWTPLIVDLLLLLTKSSLKEFVKSCVVVSAAALIGLSSYLVLLLPSANQNVLVFSRLAGVRALLHHFLRVEYGTFSLASADASAHKSYLPFFLNQAARSVPIFLASPLLAFTRMFQQRPPLLVGALVTVLLHLLFVSRITYPGSFEIYRHGAMKFYGAFGIAAAVLTACACRDLLTTRLRQACAGLLILIPSLINAPGALSRTAHRDDPMIEIELSGILRELPQNAVFVASLDRISMGLFYRQLVQQQRSDIVTISPGLLGSASYLNVLKEKYPQFVAPSAERFPLNAFVDQAINQGRKVFAYHETNLPPGYGRWPIGVTWQWMPVPFQPSIDELSARYLAFCARWPDEIVKIPATHPHSRFILDFIFVRPLVAHLRNVTGTPTYDALLNALSSLKRGNIPAARESCIKGLIELSGKSATSDPVYYN